MHAPGLHVRPPTPQPDPAAGQLVPRRVHRVPGQPGQEAGAVSDTYHHWPLTSSPPRT
jgi:hypothetical protein